MIKYNPKTKDYYDHNGEVLHSGHNIDWNRKVLVEPDDEVWFGAFKGKTPRQMLASRDGRNYLNWMDDKGFTFSNSLRQLMNGGESDVPDFLVSNNSKKMDEPMVCSNSQEAFVLFDQDLADAITTEGRKLLRRMNENIERSSRNIITNNPEAGRNYSMIY